MPSGPWIAAGRTGNYSVLLGANCHATINPLIDVQSYLSTSVVGKLNIGNYDDPKEQAIYDAAFRETDAAKQKQEMFQFAKWVMDVQAHKLMVLWWHRIVPYRSYVRGWKISPSHYINQDLSNIWLDK